MLAEVSALTVGLFIVGVILVILAFALNVDGNYRAVIGIVGFLVLAGTLVNYHLGDKKKAEWADRVTDYDLTRPHQSWRHRPHH